MSRSQIANHRPAPAYVPGGGLVASAPRESPPPGRGTVGLTTWMVVLHAATPGEDPDRQSFQLAVRAATAPAALVEGLGRWRDARRGAGPLWGLEKVEVVTLREVERVRAAPDP
jgi:hypothetical protein